MACGTKYQWDAVHRIEDAMDLLSQHGFGAGDDAYDALYESRGSALAEIGRKTPKQQITISHTEVLSRLQALGLEYASHSVGFSREELKDAVVRVYFDSDGGWMSEARFKPKGKPIYHVISTDEAMAFLRNEPSGGLIARVFDEDEYLGEG